ncbi:MULTISPECIES: hypothetical protein [Klebsiella]|uniref:hypothetical protein n=1 Tax=Klebsiella TaxID=570 RepID=UPI000FF8FC83|nr:MULTISPECIES: hypothetical protein [Klebsiella]MDT7005053.1 hypothetical protein [Klebsiella variicola]MDT7027988.1 hypothetical protein [Klebsiella variicola]QAS64431.1 hypothetical protein KOCBH_01874 [Klebsiella michiganensis]HCD5323627.1 hypothetical protein [Klebsiella michiganensis]HCD7245386.1 hypothetical protein [Klebsiella michiganensis]
MSKALYTNTNDILNALLDGTLKRHRAMANKNMNMYRESFEMAEMYRKAVALYDQLMVIKNGKK